MSHLAHVQVNGTDQRKVLSSYLVDALAEARDVEPGELSTPIYQYVDPGALDGLFDSSLPDITREGLVSFPVEELLVTIEISPDATADIRVEETPTPDEPPAQATADSDDRAPSP